MKTPPVYWLAAGLWAIPGVLLGGVGAWALKPTAASAQFEQPAATAIPERAFPGARVSYGGSGLFRVPSQVPPGSYIVAAGSGTFGCSWQRLSSDDGKPKSEIDSGAINRGGFDRFTVAPSDRFLRLFGDCTWASS